MTDTDVRQTYAEWLRERMEERQLTQRGLAKLVNPDDPETARRAVRRYLKGMVPLERSRRIIAGALESEDTGPAPDPDKEED